jgi:hypothetical protein
MEPLRSRPGWFEQPSSLVPRGAAEEERFMNETFAQGDLLIERVADVEPSGTLLAPRPARGSSLKARLPATAMPFTIV